MATQGRALGLGAVAVAAATWMLGAAATMADDPLPALPSQLLAADLQIHVAGERARVVLEQDFRALADAPSGGTVLVSVPRSAAVEDVRLAVDGRARPVTARVLDGNVAVTLPPLPAGRRFSVELTYAQNASPDADGASRMVLPAPAPTSTEAPLTLAAVVAEPLVAVRSPSHRIVGTATGDGQTWLTLRDGAVPADRAFVLEWRRVQVAAES